MRNTLWVQTVDQNNGAETLYQNLGVGSMNGKDWNVGGDWDFLDQDVDLLVLLALVLDGRSRKPESSGVAMC